MFLSNDKMVQGPHFALPGIERFTDFEKAKFAYGDLVLGSSKFPLLP